MFHFNFKLEFGKKGHFEIKLGSMYYGFELQRAKISQKQGKQLENELVKKEMELVNDDVHKASFQMTEDTNTLYMGFCRVRWRQWIDSPLDNLIQYSRKEKLDQKASYYKRSNEPRDKK